MNKYRTELLESLQNLIAIDSTESTPAPDKPFGEGIYHALSYTLNLAKSLGFTTYNYDNYIGEVVFGTGEELAILCHLDVVPVGDLAKWQFPPFDGVIDNGYLYGRGTVDDKGPLIATLYALKKLKDEGFVPNKQVRLILGCDEESGWQCIKHYKTVRPLPETGFSPDASFPVIYAEKGIYQIAMNFDYNKEKLFGVYGGVAPNVVCDLAGAKCAIDSEIAQNLGLEVTGDGVKAVGITAHASEPQNGKNALYPFVCYLSKIGAVDKKVFETLFEDSLKLKDFSDETGHLTMSPDMIEIKDGKLRITVDIRYPSTLDFNLLYEKLCEIGEFEVLSHQKPLFNDQNSPLIRTLLSVYEKHSGKKAKPIAIGGGTYARAIKLGAGFGPETDDEPLCAHQPNERISIEKLDFLFNVYYDAIKELCK